jgi:hypothetical protein
MPTEKSDATDLGSYLAGTEYIECRTVGHKFLPMHKGWLTETTDAGAVYVKRMLCNPEPPFNGCGSKRFSYYSARSLEFTHHEYDYASGYLVSGFAVPRRDANRYDLEKFIAEQRAAERAAASKAKPPRRAPRRKPGTAARNHLRAM